MGEHRIPFLCFALQCTRLIDAAIESSRTQLVDWYPEGPDLLRLDKWQKYHIIEPEFGDNTTEQAMNSALRSMAPDVAIKILHEMQKRALWLSDKRIPLPKGLTSLLGDQDA